MSFKNVLGKKKVHINKKRYQENQGSTCLSILSSADIIYRLRDYFNSFTWDEKFSLVCPNSGEISVWFTLMKILHGIVILFLHCFQLSCEVKPHHD